MSGAGDAGNFLELAILLEEELGVGVADGVAEVVSDFQTLVEGGGEIGGLELGLEVLELFLQLRDRARDLIGVEDGLNLAASIAPGADGTGWATGLERVKGSEKQIAAE